MQNTKLTSEVSTVGKLSPLKVRLDNLGTFARGSNNFMYPFYASNGKVYLTTYGPRPAKFYEIDPDTGEVATYEPGDYQLRMIAETSDGHLWTVSNYEDYLYEFSPADRAFINAYKWPARGDNMVCVTDSEDRIYTVKNRRLYSFDTRSTSFDDHGEVMPERFVFNRGQHGQFGPDGKLYAVSDTTVFAFDPRTGEIDQIITQDDIAPSIFILMGNLHIGTLDLPWLHGWAWVAEDLTDWREESIHFSHHLLFRCNVETGSVQTYPMERGKICDCGIFFDPVDRLHYFGTPGKGTIALNGFDWEKREVVRQIELPYGDQNAFVGQSPRTRHLLLSLPYLGTLIELDLATGRHRKLFENPQPAEVRCLAITRGKRSFGVTYDCGHAFERETTTTEVGRSIGFSYIFRVCYGPASVSRDGEWLIYPINCGMGIRGTGVLPTAGDVIGRHVTDLVPIHVAATAGDTFLVVHRGPWYAHQEEGRWDGRDETIAQLAIMGQGVYRLRGKSGEVEELPDVPCASLAALSDGCVIGCDLNLVWRLAPETGKPEGLCEAPDQPVRMAASPNGDRVVLASADGLFEVDTASAKLTRLADLPFSPERGLFCFASGNVVCAGTEQLALLSPGETTVKVWRGSMPGKVGPCAPPDAEALYTVDKEFTRITWGV